MLSRTVMVRFFRGDLPLAMRPEERPVRVMPDGISGVVHLGNVYPLHPGDSIDLAGTPIEGNLCLLRVAAEEEIRYAAPPPRPTVVSESDVPDSDECTFAQDLELAESVASAESELGAECERCVDLELQALSIQEDLDEQRDAFAQAEREAKSSQDALRAALTDCKESKKEQENGSQASGLNSGRRLSSAVTSGGLERLYADIFPRLKFSPDSIRLVVEKFETWKELHDVLHDLNESHHRYGRTSINVGDVKEVDEHIRIGHSSQMGRVYVRQLFGDGLFVAIHLKNDRKEQSRFVARFSNMPLPDVQVPEPRSGAESLVSR